VDGREAGLAFCLRSHLPAEAERRSVAACLGELGFRVREIEDGPWDAKQEGTLVVQGNLNWFPKLRRQLLRNRKPDGSRVVLWHTEPLPPPAVSGLHWPLPTLRDAAKIVLHDKRASDVYTNFFLLRALARRKLPDVLAVSTHGRAEFLAERCIPAHYVPLGYAPVCGYDLGLQRDIDVLFLGDLRLWRRRRMLARLRKEGIAVTAAGDWFDPALWGAARTRLLNRAKVFLSIQRFPKEFSGQRFILGVANGALVVSEPVYDAYPFVAGRHFVSAPVQQMAEVIWHYLENDSERRKITSEAYRLVTEELTMARSVAKLAALIRAPR
jgi:hypothetical protein